MYWRIAGLRLGIRLAVGPRAGWLELRLPEADDLTALAAPAEAGVIPFRCSGLVEESPPDPQ